jgi:adenylate kinase
MNPKTVLFVGPQGSGKGTQIKKLIDVLQREPSRRTVNIETGSGFREMIKDPKTFAEQKVARSLAKGELQPDFLTYILWGNVMLAELDNECHLTIDGFPRTTAQAAVVDEALAFFELTNVDVVNLDTPDEVVRERMLARGRQDDTVDSIDKRLTWYKEYSMPVLAYYRERANTAVHDINGADTIDGVHTQILNALNLT